MEKLAEKLGGKLNVIMIEVNSGLRKQISNYIGLKEQEFIMKREINKKILIIPL